MNHILVINSSLSGDTSVSRIIVDNAVKCLTEAAPGSVVTYRDVGDAPVPHLTSATVSGIRAVAETQAELAAQTLSDQLIAELGAADILVIGAPMYNFSIPSTLRTWFDHVVRPRVTFEYKEGSVQGLLTGKRAIIVESRGGIYSEGPAKAMDFQEPYLKTLLGFIGITDVTFIHAEKIGSGAEAREIALANAKSQLAILISADFMGVSSVS